jgi:glutamate transport system permease protein
MNGALFDPPGPRGRRMLLIWNAVAILVIAALIAWSIVKLREKGELSAEYWSVLGRLDLLKLFLRGLLSTLKSAVVATVLSLLLGVLLAAGRLSKRAGLRYLCRGFVELFRGLPVLLLIFFVFLGLPVFGIQVSPFWALVLGISLYNGALIGEVFRGGILALPRGQTEGGYAVGLTESQTMRYVLLPQAVRQMLPALISQLVVIVKESSLGFIVGYLELTRNANAAVSYLGGEFYTLPIYTAMAAIYVALNSSLSLLARWTERFERRRYGRTISATFQVDSL